MEKRQSDNKKTKQVRINADLHHALKISAAKSKMSLKTLVETYLTELVEIAI